MFRKLLKIPKLAGQSSVSTSRGENADAIKALISTMELEKENRHKSGDLC